MNGYDELMSYEWMDSRMNSEMDSEMDSKMTSEMDSEMDVQMDAEMDIQMDANIGSETNAEMDAQMDEAAASETDIEMVSQTSDYDMDSSESYPRERTGFFHLPAEIRLQIYGEIFPPSSRHAWPTSIHLEYNTSARALTGHKFPAICLASGQLYRETIPFHLRAESTELRIDGVESSRFMVQWLSRFGDEAFKAVRRLVIRRWSASANDDHEIVPLLSRCTNCQSMKWTFRFVYRETCQPSISRVEKVMRDAGMGSRECGRPMVTRSGGAINVYQEAMRVLD